MVEHLPIDTIAQADAGTLTAEELRAVQAHLAECTDCSERLEQVRRVPTELAAAAPEQMPAAVAGRLEAVIAAEVDRREVLRAKTERDRTTPAESARGTKATARTTDADRLLV